MRPGPFQRLLVLLDNWLVAEGLFQWVGSRVRPYVLPVPRPAPFTFTVTREVLPMAFAFEVKIHMPTVPAAGSDPSVADVAKQTITTTVNGTAQAPVDIPLDQVDDVVGDFQIGDQLSCALQYFDKFNNGSAIRTAVTTIAVPVGPPEPGEFGFSITEVDVPDAPPTPAPTPTPDSNADLNPNPGP